MWKHRQKKETCVVHKVNIFYRFDGLAKVVSCSVNIRHINQLHGLNAQADGLKKLITTSFTNTMNSLVWSCGPAHIANSGHYCIHLYALTGKNSLA